MIMIKTLKQLRIEKKRLMHRQVVLENLIKYHWIDFTESLKPINLAKNIFEKEQTKRSEGAESIKELIVGFATHFTNKILDSLLDKFKKWYNE